MMEEFTQVNYEDEHRRALTRRAQLIRVSRPDLAQCEHLDSPVVDVTEELRRVINGYTEDTQ